MFEASSSIYSTPLITDLFSDGVKDIVINSFLHYLEVVQADDGAETAGFPAFHASKVHSSPLMYDMDQDGVQDILVATYDGEILFYKDTGEQMTTKLVVPRLSVKRCDLGNVSKVVSIPHGFRFSLFFSRFELPLLKLYHCIIIQYQRPISHLCVLHSLRRSFKRHKQTPNMSTP